MRNYIKMTKATNCWCVPGNAKPVRIYDIVKKKKGNFIAQFIGATNEEMEGIKEAETFEEAMKIAKENGVVRINFFEVA